jgi:steroid delta-isomerase-like uncharacterized protein
MTTKELAQRWFEELWNQRRPEVIHEMMEPGAVACTEGGLVTGPEVFLEQMYRPLTTTFPDLHVRVEGVVEDGDEAVVRWTASGTQGGAFGPLPASGRTVRFSGMTWFRFRDGRIVEGCDRWNFHGLVNFLSTGEEAATVKGSP